MNKIECGFELDWEIESDFNRIVKLNCIEIGFIFKSDYLSQSDSNRTQTVTIGHKWSQTIEQLKWWIIKLNRIEKLDQIRLKWDLNQIEKLK